MTVYRTLSPRLHPRPCVVVMKEPVLKTRTWEHRCWTARKKGQDPLRCNRASSHLLNDRYLCRAHAGQEAIRLLEEQDKVRPADLARLNSIRGLLEELISAPEKAKLALPLLGSAAFYNAIRDLGDYIERFRRS